MSPDILIDITSLGKSFPKYHEDQRAYIKREVLGTLGLARASSSLEMVNVLKDISLSVARGESVAILGKNGAGKSTLLKIIQGVLSASSGAVSITGSVGGLVELTAGFQDSLTGEHNVINRARALGIIGDELKDIVRKVEDFSDIGDYFYQPVRTYSSGMKARVGFGVSISLPYDIMLCDEALSVGDALFQQKCLSKINELKADRAFIFVSHSMTQVRRFCEKAIVLDGGVIKYTGVVDEAVLFYEREILKLSPPPLTEKKRPTIARSYLEPLLYNHSKVLSAESSLTFSEDNAGFELRGRFHLSLDGEQPKFIIGVPILNVLGDMVTGISCEDASIFYNKDTCMLEFTLSVPVLCLNPGEYTALCVVQDSVEKIYRQAIDTFWIGPSKRNTFGYFTPEYSWL